MCEQFTPVKHHQTNQLFQESYAYVYDTQCSKGEHHLYWVLNYLRTKLFYANAITGSWLPGPIWNIHMSAFTGNLKRFCNVHFDYLGIILCTEFSNMKTESN